MRQLFLFIAVSILIFCPKSYANETLQAYPQEPGRWPGILEPPSEEPTGENAEIYKMLLAREGMTDALKIDFDELEPDSSN